MLKIGIIGYGVRMRTVVTEIVKTQKIQIVAVADPDIAAAKESAAFNGVEDCRFYNDAEEMLNKEALDGVCIGTRCSTHTKYALMAAERGLPMFLEKPVCTNYEDLERLKGILHHNDKTVVSFPLRLTSVVSYVKDIIDSGRIGRVEHVQAYNNVPYGRGYYHKWYRDEEETGGMFLQKATHDFDYINYILGDVYPETVCAMKSKQIFKGDKPAGLMCKDCPEFESCPESPKNVAKLGDGNVIGPYCCFAEDTGNEDSGSAIVRYDSGMHVVYSQNFVVRASAGKRGARFIGYLGTLEFDFFTGVVTVFHHRSFTTETHTVSTKGTTHFGGDTMLVENFIGIMEGREISHSNLKEGILSAEMCLAAKASAETDRFMPIEFRV